MDLDRVNKNTHKVKDDIIIDIMQHTSKDNMHVYASLLPTFIHR